jgi:hypothetical protein
MMGPETSRTAGVAAPSDPMAAIPVDEQISQEENSRTGCTCTSAIPALHRTHRHIASAMAVADDDDPALIEAAMQVEAGLIATRPRTIGDAYRRLLALCPTLETDLTAPELALLRAEIEAEIGEALT